MLFCQKVLRIRERVVYLEAMDGKYVSFSNKPQELAGGFHEKAIMALVKQHTGSGHQTQSQGASKISGE